MPSELFVQKPRQLIHIPYEEAPLKPDEIRAQALLSGISHGTELSGYRGTTAFLTKEFDRDLRLLRPKKDVSEQPTKLGYEWVGRVTEVGSDVTTHKVGDLVHMPLNHRDTQTFSIHSRGWYGSPAPLPEGFSPDQGIFLALAGVALQSIHDAHVKVGDRIAIFGMGAIGLLAVQLAKLNGASWVDAVDLIPRRRELAARFGADQTYDPSAVEVSYEIKSSTPERGADVAIELSGSYAALNEAIRTVRKGGTVVAASYYQGGASALHLGEEFHHNRVTLLCSMGSWDNMHRDAPMWDRARIHRTIIQLLLSGVLRTDDMITHRIPFERASEAYALIDEHPEEVVKVVLSY